MTNRIMEMTTSTEYQMNIWDDETLVPYEDFAKHYMLATKSINTETMKIIIPITDTHMRSVFKLTFGE